MLGRQAPPPDAVLRYGETSDEVVDAWFAHDRAGAARPLVVLVHGGFWRPAYDRLHLRPMATALRAGGWDVASIEYRRIPGQPDLTANDVRAALQALPHLVAGARPESRPIRESGLIVVGHSAGGHLALLAAATVPAGRATTPIVAVVALAPVADLRLADRLDLDDGAVADFLGVPPQMRGDLDVARLASPAVPVVIVHGNGDSRVPAALSESYAAAHPNTRLVRIPDADHFALIDPRSTAWPLVVGALWRIAHRAGDAVR